MKNLSFPTLDAKRCRSNYGTSGFQSPYTYKHLRGTYVSIGALVLEIMRKYHILLSKYFYSTK